MKSYRIAISKIVPLGHFVVNHEFGLIIVHPESLESFMDLWRKEFPDLEKAFAE